MPPKVAHRLDEARERLAESVEKMHEWDAKAQSLPDEADEKEIEFVRDAFEAAARENRRWQETVDRLAEIESARAAVAARQSEDEEERSQPQPERSLRNVLGVKEEKTYTAKSADQGISFFRDLANSVRGDGMAMERLSRHTREIAMERRDITTVVTDGGNFVPPQYLGELYAGIPRSGRPFADAIPSRPLMSTGMNITIPRITTGTTAAIQVGDLGAVSETDIVENLYTIPVCTIAGMQDVSQQLFDRAEPGIDEVIFGDLRAAYDEALDSQLINGTGLNSQHLGIDDVTAPNTVTYTDASPTAAETLPPIYDAISQIMTNRKQSADTILLHPRRAAFLAADFGTTFPLFQQGNLFQAVGTQDLGMTTGLAGLRVVIDPNITTTDNVNQDKIYVVRTADMILWEGPLQARVYPEIGSGTLTVRLQLFGYSAFASERYAKGISIISGTGLATPAFV